MLHFINTLEHHALVGVDPEVAHARDKGQRFEDLSIASAAVARSGLGYEPPDHLLADHALGVCG